MKKILLLISLVWINAAVWGQKIPPAPNPPRLVNDFAGILSAEQKQHLEDLLVAFDDSSSIQIAVVTVTSLQDYEPVDFATKLGREWGVGNKKTNNGVILLVSTEPDRRRVFIAPGYGLEGAIPDIIAKRIVEDNILPNFRQGNYYRGISAGVESIMAASRGEYTAPEGYRNRGDGDNGGGSILFIIIMVVVLLLLFRRGGGGNNRGGTMTRRGYHDGIPPIFWFPTGGRGSGWGGGGGGFGGGGGGFGGFGGGGFGGGGAGGSW